MSSIAGIELDPEEELTLFTCFAVATTYDEDNTERLYNTAECTSVARQLIKRKKPDFFESNASKRVDIGWLRKKWRNQGASRPEVIAMREDVENDKAYYLGRASELFEQCQNKIHSSQKKKKKKIPRSDNDGYGDFQVPGYTVSTPYGHPQTHEYTSTFQSQQSASSDQMEKSPNQRGEVTDSLRRSDDDGYGHFQVPGYTVSTPHGHPQTHEYTSEFPYQQSVVSDPQMQVPAPTATKGITVIGDSEYNSFRDYTGGTARYECTSLYDGSHYQQSYGAPGFAPKFKREDASPHAQENYQAWQKWSSAQNSTAILKKSDFDAAQDYLGDEAINRCTSKGPDGPHGTESYGAPATLDFFGRPPSPHAVENHDAWKAQTREALKRKAAAAEASSSSGKSKSPAYHEERREREREHERRDQPAKSHGKKSGGSSKQKDSKSKDTQPKKSHGSKSGDGSKKKEGRSKDDTQGSGRRRGERQ